MTGSPPSPISSEAAYDNEMSPANIHGETLDEFCDEIRSRLESKEKKELEAEAEREKSEESQGNLVNFPGGKPGGAFPEDESIASENSFFGMAALHHSNQELKALLESLTSAVQVSEDGSSKAARANSNVAEQKLNERDSQLAKMQIEAELVHTTHQKTYDKLNDKMLEQEEELEDLRHKLKVLAAEKSEVEREKIQFENEAISLRQEKERLKAFAVQVESKYHELRTKSANIVYQNANRAREIEKRDIEIRELAATIEMRGNQLTQSNTSFEKQRKVIEKLQLHVGNQQQHMAMLVEQQAKFKADIEQHREINAKTKDMLSITRKMSKSKLDLRDREIERLKSVIEGLRAKIENFEFEYPQYRNAG